MAKVRNTREAVIHLLALSLVCFLLITISVKKKYNSTFIQIAVISALAPVQDFAAKSINLMSRGVNFYFDLVGVKKENETLKKELNSLKADAARLAELNLENQRLRQMLAFKENSPLKLVAARVIGVDATNWSRTIIIDRGSGDGLRDDMSVATPNGLVGKLIEVSPAYSKAMLLTDGRSAVDGIVQRSRASGVVFGTSEGTSIMRYLPLDADVRPGDLIISSGMGGVFPKGLVVGKVKKLDNSGQSLFKEAEIDLGATLANLEEVFVIVK